MNDQAEGAKLRQARIAYLTANGWRTANKNRSDQWLRDKCELTRRLRLQTTTPERKDDGR